ncbi:MAG TPA: squalene/phytoene synthase family protein [Hyphomicrobiaceae bacterium]
MADEQEDESGGAATEGGADIADIARAGEPDRYLAALLTPAPQRQALLALAAFATELARIPRRAVREPFMGEVRLQWWRDALARPEAESAGHAVADGVRRAARRHGLPAALLGGMIDARGAELLAAPFHDDAALYDFLQRSEGAHFALACRVTGFGVRPDVEAASATAGRAYGLARLLLGLPRSLALGRVPLAHTRIAAAGLTAQDLLAGAGGDKAEALVRAYIAQIRGSLAEARGLARALPRPARTAFLPLALVGSYVRVLERQGSEALRAAPEIVPLTRVWKVGMAHLLGRP